MTETIAPATTETATCLPKLIWSMHVAELALTQVGIVINELKL